MKTNSDNFNTKPDTSSTWNLNAKNPLINVPKKYQFRCKRLNFDYPSVISSNKSKNQSENLQIQQTFHTKSGPIQINEALNIQSNEAKPLYTVTFLSNPYIKMKKITCKQ